MANKGNPLITKGPDNNVSGQYLGTYHMVGDTRFEPQRTNNFEVQITGLDNVLTDFKGGLISNASASITLSVADYDAPSLTISPIEIAYGNNIVKFAGKPTFETSSITLNDYIGLKVEQILNSWYALTYDVKTQKVGLAKNYKKEGFLIEYAPDGTNIRQWHLHGCWISSLDLGKFSQDGNAVRQVTVTLVYDYASPVVNP
jgi:hypothetical protein